MNVKLTPDTITAKRFIVIKGSNEGLDAGFVAEDYLASWHVVISAKVEEAIKATRDALRLLEDHKTKLEENKK